MVSVGAVSASEVSALTDDHTYQSSSADFDVDDDSDYDDSDYEDRKSTRLNSSHAR